MRYCYSISHQHVRALALGVTLGMVAIIAPCWWAAVWSHQPTCTESKSDFTAFYTAASLLARGGAAELYDIGVQKEFQAPINPARAHWVMPYYYPPFFAAVLLPLGWITYSYAFAVMTALNAILLIASLILLIRKLRLNTEQIGWLLLATGCNFGVHYTILEGQTSFISLLLLVLFTTDVRATAGVWAGLLFFKPSLALAPLLALIVRKKWPAITMTALVLIFLGSVSWFVVGWDGLQNYKNLTLRVASGEAVLQINAERMQNLRGIAMFLLQGFGLHHLWWIGSLVVLSVALVQIARTDSWSMFIIATILAAPHLHNHDLSLLLIPTAFFLKSQQHLRPITALILLMFGMAPVINNVLIAPPILAVGLLLVFAFSLTKGERSTFLSANGASPPIRNTA